MIGNNKSKERLFIFSAMHQVNAKLPLLYYYNNSKLLINMGRVGLS